MSITLLCLVKGNTTTNAFAVDIESDKLVSHLKDAIKAKKAPEFNSFPADKLKLWKVEIPDDQDDLRNLVLQDNEELRATRKISKYFPTLPAEEHIHIIIKLPLFSLEEALSCIPLSVTYSKKCTTSKTTTKVNGNPPANVLLWETLFDEVNRFYFDQQSRFERPKFVGKSIVNEEDVRVAIDVNICMVLSELTPEYNFSRLPTPTPGIPDFTCYYLPDSERIPGDLLILSIEVKRKHVLQGIEGHTFPEFYRKSNRAKMVVQQIYNYMKTDNLKYGILSTYDNHWFLKREQTNLWISKTLPLQSTSPPVLKTYAYLARQAQSYHQSLRSNHVSVPSYGGSNTRTLRSHSKNLSCTNQRTSSSDQQTPATNNVYQQNYHFTDFEFKDILGTGHSGKTLLCKFRGDTIALKSADLSKTSPEVLQEMQKEVEIYKLLSDIQGKYIPKLICYGYYGGGMAFVIGLTIVGSPLSDGHKLTKLQKRKALKVLRSIHEHGVLHNDIQEENILVDNNQDVFLIDFGMATLVDYQSNRKVFNEEVRQFSQLLDKYLTNNIRNIGEFSIVRECKVVG